MGIRKLKNIFNCGREGRFFEGGDVKLSFVILVMEMRSVRGIELGKFGVVEVKF